MSIDYSGVFPCKVREAVNDADLLRMKKARSQVDIVLKLMRDRSLNQGGLPEPEWTFMLRQAGAEGVKDTKVRVGDLLAESAPLARLSPNCMNCPMNVRATDFGCGGGIQYPISARAEEWLISRLPDELNSPAGVLLKRAIQDFGYDGAGIDAARSRKELYEASAPAVRKWGGWFSRRTVITSSQILHMVFGVGSLQPVHAKLVAYFTGFVDDAFKTISGDAERPSPSDDIGVAGMKSFFLTAALAGEHGVGVLIDA